MLSDRRARVDRILLTAVLLLVVGGLFIFMSASFGLLAYHTGVFSASVKSQVLVGLGGGGIAFFIGMRVSYRLWRRFALWFFAASILLTLLVFVPHLGFTYNGARRWISVGPITFQPSETIKIAYILYLAAWLSSVKNKIGEFRYGLAPFCAITGIVGVVLLAQPDTVTFLVIVGSGLAMFLAAGARWRDIAILALIGMLGMALLVSFRPYVANRFTVFLHPGSDSLGHGYQIQQSLLAVGAGEIFGRGFGQSIQKFGNLPEPTSDSIFSVYSEEFGFLGSAALIILYAVFALRGLWVAARAPDLFGGLVATGIVVLIVSQSFVNIGAMLGILPLSGLPLEFISHGGSALLVALGAAGILLSVSRSVRA